jgi:hypothetical protein
MSPFGTNTTLGDIRFSAGHEGEADISRSLAISCDLRVHALAMIDLVWRL